MIFQRLEIQFIGLENHCVNPDSIFLIAETDDGEIAGFITASCNWNKFISVDYIAVERTKRRTGADVIPEKGDLIFFRQGVVKVAIVTAENKPIVTIELTGRNINVPFLVLHADLRKYFISAARR